MMNDPKAGEIWWVKFEGWRDLTTVEIVRITGKIVTFQTETAAVWGLDKTTTLKRGDLEFVERKDD